MGRRSSRSRACRILSVPAKVKARAVRPHRVGSTQSNMSIPAATPSIRSIGRPTPIRYRGRSAGMCGMVAARVVRIASAPSPTESPPTANPSNGMPARASALARRSCGSSPPCTMPKRACSGRVWTVKHRSAQARDRCIASSTRAGSAGRPTTSSSCIAMSAPRLCWIRIESSGVSRTAAPSMCERNDAPASVIFT